MGKYSEKEIRLRGGFEFNVRYNVLALFNSYKAEGIKYEKHSQVELLKCSCQELGICENARKVEIHYSGNVMLDSYIPQISSGNIYKDSFGQIRERENHNPFIRALRTEGIGYVLDIALEVEPELTERIDKYNNPIGVIIEIMKKPELLYYVVKRLIQEDIRSDLIDAQSLNGADLALAAKEDFQLEYYKISKKKIPLQHKKADKDKTVVLTIVSDIYGVGSISEVNKTLLPSKDYECYVEAGGRDAIGIIEDRKPDIIVVPFYWVLFDIKRLLQKARLVNPDLQIIMYYDSDYDFNHPISDRERRYFEKFKNISFINYYDYFSLYFVTDRYVREIQEARQKIREEKTPKLKSVVEDARKNRSQS